MLKSKFFLFFNLCIFSILFISQKVPHISKFIQPIQDCRLVAPNGEPLFTNLKELRNEIMDPVKDKFKDNLNFKIKKIIYIPNEFDKGIIADIKYELPNGNVTNIFILKNISNEYIHYKPEWKIIGNAINNQYKETKPIVKFSCSGSPCCQVHSHISNDGTTTFDCSCDNCIMTVYNDIND